MNRTIYVVLLITLVVLGALYALIPQLIPHSPVFSVSLPAAGSQLQAGQTVAISWASSAIPSSDKVAVSIRRIPPPPLPLEGQEFDPVIFTDLPNTGSVSWAVSPMYPNGTYVLDVSAYESIPVKNPISTSSERFTISHPVLAADLQPLYSGVSWNGSEIESVTIGTSTMQGESIASAPIENTMNPGSIFTPFTAYYDRLLKSRGWRIANDLAAGGHVGGQTGYRKGTDTILVRFSILYHSVSSSSPSECPCDVTLSLFSSP